MSEEWRSMSLSEVFALDNARLGPHTNEPQVLSLSKYKGFVRSEEYFDKRIASAKLDAYKIIVQDGWAYSTIHIDEGSIARNTLGFPGVISPMYTTLRWIGEEHEPAFFELLLRSPEMLAKYQENAQGSINRRRSLPFKSFAALTVEAPPLSVQRRIADLMAYLDGHLANLRAEREQVAVLREATLATRLGAGTAAERTTLGELLSQDGGSLITGPFGTALKASEYANEGVPVISVGEIGAGALKVRPDTPRVSTGTIARLPQYVLTAGDIVFARKGAIDRSAIVKPSAAGYFLGSDGLRLRFQDLQLGAFIAAQLTGSSAARWLRQNAGGTTMPSLSQTTLRRLPIVLPSAASQAQIAQQMEAFDHHLERLTREIDALQSAISALLASLLTQKSCIADSYDSILPGVA